MNIRNLITGFISIALFSGPFGVPSWARTFSGTGVTPDGTKVIYALDNNHGTACIKINNVYAIGWIKSDSDGNFIPKDLFVFQGATATLEKPGNTLLNVSFKVISMSSKDGETQNVYEGCKNLPPSLKWTD